MKRTMQFSESAQQYSLIEDFNAEPNMDKYKIEDEIISLANDLARLDNMLEILRRANIEESEFFIANKVLQTEKGVERLKELFKMYNNAS